MQVSKTPGDDKKTAISFSYLRRQCIASPCGPRSSWVKTKSFWASVMASLNPGNPSITSGARDMAALQFRRACLRTSAAQFSSLANRSGCVLDCEAHSTYSTKPLSKSSIKTSNEQGSRNFFPFRVSWESKSHRRLQVLEVITWPSADRSAGSSFLKAERQAQLCKLSCRACATFRCAAALV